MFNNWSSSGVTDGSSWFSNFSEVLGAGSQFVGSLGNLIHHGNTPISAGNSGPLNPIEQPTYSGQSQTTAPVQNNTNYMPYVLIGGGILAALLLLKG